MTDFKVTNELITTTQLPAFSFTVSDSDIITLYSDTDMQTDILNGLRANRKAMIFDWQDGLYERLTVESNLAFYRKWFDCQLSLAEILVLFQLHSCAKIPLNKCSLSEVRRVYYAKYFMSQSHASDPLVFVEPVHGIDVLTMDTFIVMLEKLQEMKAPVLILVTNLEHALLYGEKAYKMDKKGLGEINVETDKYEEEIPKNQVTTPSVANLYKVPGKVDDKVILFDPTEIDYIESQDGKHWTPP